MGKFFISVLTFAAVIGPLVFWTEIRQVLTTRNRPVSPGGCLLGFWGLPFRDLAQLRDLIKSEPDSLMRPSYIRLERSFYISIAVAIMLLIWIFAFRPFGVVQKDPPLNPPSAKP